MHSPHPQFGPDPTLQVKKETEAQSRGESMYIQRHKTSVEVMERKWGLESKRKPGPGGWGSLKSCLVLSPVHLPRGLLSSAHHQLVYL